MVTDLHKLTLAQTVHTLAISCGAEHQGSSQRLYDSRPLFLGPERHHDSMVINQVFVGRRDIRWEVQEVSVAVDSAGEKVFRHDGVGSRLRSEEAGGVYISKAFGLYRRPEESKGRGTRGALNINQDGNKHGKTCTSQLPAQQPTQ